MFQLRKMVLGTALLFAATLSLSAQEGPDNLPFNCRVTSTPPLVRLEGVAELAGDVLISCSGIVPDQGNQNVGTDENPVLVKRDLRGNVTLRADVPVTSQYTGATPDINGRLLTDALIINSGHQGSAGGQASRCGFGGNPDEFNCAPQTPIGPTGGYIGQGAPYVGGSPVFAFPYVVAAKNHGWWTPQDAMGATLEWDDVLLAPGSAAGKQWYMQLRITNVRINAASYIGLADFAPAINAVITINTQAGNVTSVPDTVIIARPRPSFRVTSTSVTKRNCDYPQSLTQNIDIIELLPNAFRPRIDTQVDAGTGPGDQDNPNTAYFTESGLMLDDVWDSSAPDTGNTGVATQGTQFNVSVITPITLDIGAAPFTVAVAAGADDATGSAMVTSAGTAIGSATVSGNDRIRNFRIEVTDFNLDVDPFLTNAITVPINVGYDETLYGAASIQVWYLPLSNAATQSTVHTGDQAVPRFVPSIKTTEGFVVTRCRTLLLFPYVTNRNGFNTGIAISNTSSDDSVYGEDAGASPQTGPCTLHMFGGNNGPANPVAQPDVESNINVPPGGMYLMTLQTGGQVKGAAGQNVGPIGAAAGFEGYIIASCEFQYAHGYAFISDTQVARVAQGYLALIIPDRTVTVAAQNGDSSERPASTFNLGEGVLGSGEQLVH
jgi:hypothetical protein